MDRTDYILGCDIYLLMCCTMIYEKISETEYLIILYNYDDADDYTAGNVKRNEKSVDEDSFYWRFYPSLNSPPLNASDLKGLYEFIAELNKNEI